MAWASPAIAWGIQGKHFTHYLALYIKNVSFFAIQTTQAEMIECTVHLYVLFKLCSVTAYYYFRFRLEQETMIGSRRNEREYSCDFIIFTF